MWTERLKPFRDGLVVPSIIALVVCTILTAWSAEDAKKPSQALQCQEVVIELQEQGSVLAQCPAGTYVELEQGLVVCRCGNRPIVTFDPFGVEIDPPNEPAPTLSPPLLPPDPVPPVQSDDKTTWL